MRRASTCLALLGLAVLGTLGAPALAAAEEEIPAPEVSLKVKAVPIPKPGGGTWPGTGNYYGKGAAVEAEFNIKGTGYGKSPKNPNGGLPPLSAVNFYLPKGTKLHPSGFGACTEEKLETKGAIGCPTSSVASPIGSALGEVTFEGERVPEETTLQAFFGPSGTILFFSKYHSGAVNPSAPLGAPAAVEIISSGKYVKSSGKFAWELKTLVPEVKTVEGAPLGAVSKIKIKAGAAIKKGKTLISYGTIPKKGECHGAFPVKAEVTFGGSFGPKHEFGIAAKTVTVNTTAPCPKH